MLIGLSGFAGVGKDTVADSLVRDFGYVKIALADPIKRIVRDVYAFTDEQLWGPSSARNAPDVRYRREHTIDSKMGKDKGVFGSSGVINDPICICCGVEDFTKQCYLTPRYTLQQLGTEWARACYDDTWVEYVVRIAERLQRGDCYYDKQTGLRSCVSVSDVMEPKKSVVIPDVRFKNEIIGLKKAGAKLVRIVRPGYEEPKWDHISETEQLQIPNKDFDYIFDGGPTLEGLDERIDQMMGVLSK